MADGAAKRTAASALVVLLALGVAGGWNYHRNLQAEQAAAGRTPFRGYADADLDALRAAYQAEIDGMKSEYETLVKRRARVRSTQGVGEGVAQFERVQSGKARLREITEELDSQEARVAEISAEQRRRAQLGTGLALHLRRLTGVAIPL